MTELDFFYRVGLPWPLAPSWIARADEYLQIVAADSASSPVRGGREYVVCSQATFDDRLYYRYRAYWINEKVLAVVANFAPAPLDTSTAWSEVFFFTYDEYGLFHQEGEDHPSVIEAFVAVRALRALER